MALAAAPTTWSTAAVRRARKWLSSFTATCYHQTCDAWSPNWNLQGAAQEADLFYAIGNRLANSRTWPQWDASSEFAKVRAQSAAQRSGGAAGNRARALASLEALRTRSSR